MTVSSRSVGPYEDCSDSDDVLCDGEVGGGGNNVNRVEHVKQQFSCVGASPSFCASIPFFNERRGCVHCAELLPQFFPFGGPAEEREEINQKLNPAATECWTRRHTVCTLRVVLAATHRRQPANTPFIRPHKTV